MVPDLPDAIWLLIFTMKNASVEVPVRQVFGEGGELLDEEFGFPPWSVAEAEAESEVAHLLYCTDPSNCEFCTCITV